MTRTMRTLLVATAAYLVAQVLQEALAAVPVGGDLGAQRDDGALDDVVEPVEHRPQDPPTLGAYLLIDGNVLDDRGAHLSLLLGTACNILP